MRAKVTNAWSSVAGAGREDGPGISRVVIESTLPPAAPRLVRPAPDRLVLELAGLSLNMPAGRLPVHDGLISAFAVTEPSPGLVRVDIELEHPAEARLEVAPGLPVRTSVILDRRPIRDILAGLVIAIDPGHGGEDAGARGPINLQEKNITLHVARRLAEWLAAAGARPVLTRESDTAVPAGERLLRAREAGAQCFVSLHTAHSPRREPQGTRTLYRPGGEALAECLHRAVLAKVRRPDRGIRRDDGRSLPGQPPCPAAGVELVCIANPLEEAWLRSPVFKDRLAQGLANGLKDYFHRMKGDRPR